MLLVGEPLGRTAEDVPDPVQGVAGPAAVAVDLLLDAAADFIDSPAGESDHMKGVEHCGGVGEFVVDGVLVAPERIQRGDFHPSLERLAALVEPRLVHRARAARHEVQQSRVDASVLVTGQVDHAGEFLRAAPAGADVVPQVLIHAEGGHAREPRLIGGGTGQDRLDAGPHRSPGGAQLAGQPGDAGVLASDLFGRPAAGPGGEHRAGLGDLLVLLGEHPHRTRRLGTRPGALAPPHHGRFGAPKQGVSIRRTVRRPWEPATTPHEGQPITVDGDSTVICNRPGSRSTPMTWRPGRPTNRSQRSQ